ncbi:MAG: UvrD-helicase domain-containing protein, partial [Oscillospiraceae bacterium]|nr:UvrD-helicase domain-containing protein [Oscillospiraceae bacterium]
MYEDDRNIVQSPEESEEKRSEAELREELIGNKSLDTYRENYLVEAGAGAGKTYILTNRVITQLLSG